MCIYSVMKGCAGWKLYTWRELKGKVGSTVLFIITLIIMNKFQINLDFQGLEHQNKWEQIKFKIPIYLKP